MRLSITSLSTYTAVDDVIVHGRMQLPLNEDMKTQTAKMKMQH